MKHKKWMVLFVVLAFWLNCHAAIAANFADINQVPWSGAATYINKVADAGLMVGDVNTAGQTVFRPRDTVTYCEVAQLAYKLLSSYYGSQQVSAEVMNKYKAVLQAYSIPSWAQPACAFCLDKGALLPADLAYFMQNASTGQSANALRENVGTIFGRAMSGLMPVNSGAALSFKDAAAISSASVPYIDLLVRIGILSGDSLGNFNPKNTINRSEMAVIVSKTHDYLGSYGGAANSGSISGRLQSIVPSGAQYILTISSGAATKTLQGTSSTPCLQGSTNISIASLKAGDQVMASYQGNNVVSILLLAASSTPNTGTQTGSNTVSGTYVGMNNSVINVEVNDRTLSYHMATGISFVLGGFSVDLNNMITSAEYGDRITLTLNAHNEVTRAVISLKRSNPDKSGYYKSMSASSITLKNSKSSSSSTKYEYVDDNSDKVDFYVDGDISSYNDFKDEVRSNDYIELFYNDDDEVIEVRLVYDADTEYDEEGYFYDMQNEYIRITDSRSSSSTDRYYFDNKDYDDVEFYVDDEEVSYSKFKNTVEEDDEIGLMLNGDDEVTEVWLLEETEEYDEDGYFDSVSNSSINIKPSKSSSSSDKYYFEDDDYDNVDFYVDGDSKTFSRFKDLAEEDDEVSLELNKDDEVTAVYLKTDKDDDYDEEGYFYDMDDDSIRITHSRSSSSADKFYFDDDDSDKVEFYDEDGDHVSFDKFEKLVEEDDEIGLVLNSSDEVLEVWLIEQFDGDDKDEEYKLKGFFGAIDADGTYITFKKSKSGSATKYFFDDEDSDNVDFYLDDASSTFSKIEYSAREDDILELLLNGKDEVLEVRVTLAGDEEDAGTLTSLSSSRLELDDDATYKIADEDDLDIDVEDGSETTITTFDELMDAYEDDKVIEVDIVVNADEEVTAIEGYVSEVRGELRSMDARDEELKVRTDSGTSVTYLCASSCSVKIASSDYDDDLFGLEDAVDDDRDVEVILTLNASGKITEIDADW